MKRCVFLVNTCRELFPTSCASVTTHLIKNNQFYFIFIIVRKNSDFVTWIKNHIKLLSHRSSIFCFMSTRSSKERININEYFFFYSSPLPPLKSNGRFLICFQNRYDSNVSITHCKRNKNQSIYHTC